MSNQPKIARFADRLAKLADDYRDDVASVVEEIKAADLDVPAVRRLAAWSRRDPVKRAEQEAIDEQYRFLAGETETPASLPAEGPLAEAARLYACKLSVRQVAEVLKVSVGRAQKLRTLASLFTVHVHDDVNTSGEESCGPVFTPRMALNRLGSDDRPGTEDEVRVHPASASTDGGASRDTGAEQATDLCAGPSSAAPQSPPQPDACSTEEQERLSDRGSASDEQSTSCGLCPVPPGSVAPVSTETASDEGVSRDFGSAARGHSSAGCDGVLATDRLASRREDRASPGPQDLVDDGLDPPPFLDRRQRVLA